MIEAIRTLPQSPYGLHTVPYHCHFFTSPFKLNVRYKQDLRRLFYFSWHLWYTLTIPGKTNRILSSKLIVTQLANWNVSEMSIAELTNLSLQNLELQARNNTFSGEHIQLHCSRATCRATCGLKTSVSVSCCVPIIRVDVINTTIIFNVIRSNIIPVP